MFRVYLSSLRLAVALLCVGVSLLLGGQWLGFVPDVDRVRMSAQQQYCEAIAINAAGAIRRQQWNDLKTLVGTLTDRNPELLSIGIRSELGQLRIDSGHHEAFWSADPVRAGGDPSSDRPGESSITDQQVHTFSVPITLNRRHWGTVEFCFAGNRSTLLSSLTDHSLFPLICFFCVAGLIPYAIVMARVLGAFNRTQVVPDRVRQALDTLAEGLLVLDDQGKIALANRAFVAATGCDADTLKGQHVDQLAWVGINDPRSEPTPWAETIAVSRVKSGVIMRYRLSDGDECVFSVNSAPIGGAGERRGALVTCRDVTHIEAHRAEQEKMLSMLRSGRDEIRRKNRELEILATQDSLTGCLNRRAFFESFESLWADAKATDSPLACLMFDNDHFKNVNDTYGHHVGDEVLRHVSATLKNHFADRYPVCRYGGEEFCVVLPGMDATAAAAQAEAARQAIMMIRLDQPAELRLTASIGVSDIRFGAAAPQDLINQADACLYVAKDQGRNRVVTYRAGMELLEKSKKPKDRGRVDEQDIVAMPFQAVTALLSALSHRDSETAEHSRRVSELCVQMAEGWLDQRETYTLEIAGLLHDIGKIGVPDHVLLKPGKLTSDEWALMSRHDDIGTEIIEGTFGCPALSAIIKNHHAFFGASGRHAGLPKGLDIPLGARILSIADSYDAMVSDRIYRSGRSHQQAIDELRRCAGTQFDPELVERFVAKVKPRAAVDPSANGRLSKQTALKIGLQIERLADAIDDKDLRRLGLLAGKLGDLARSQDFAPIAQTADRILRLADEQQSDWLQVLAETQELLNLCRSTQNTFLGDSRDRNRKIIDTFLSESAAATPGVSVAT